MSRDGEQAVQDKKQMVVTGVSQYTGCTLVLLAHEERRGFSHGFAGVQ